MAPTRNRQTAALTSTLQQQHKEERPEQQEKQEVEQHGVGEKQQQMRQTNGASSLTTSSASPTSSSALPLPGACMFYDFLLSTGVLGSPCYSLCSTSDDELNTSSSSNAEFKIPSYAFGTIYNKIQKENEQQKENGPAAAKENSIADTNASDLMLEASVSSGNIEDNCKRFGKNAVHNLCYEDNNNNSNSKDDHSNSDKSNNDKKYSNSNDNNDKSSYMNRNNNNDNDNNSKEKGVDKDKGDDYDIDNNNDNKDENNNDNENDNDTTKSNPIEMGNCDYMNKGNNNKNGSERYNENENNNGINSINSSSNNKISSSKNNNFTGIDLRGDNRSDGSDDGCIKSSVLAPASASQSPSPAPLIPQSLLSQMSASASPSLSSLTSASASSSVTTPTPIPTLTSVLRSISASTGSSPVGLTSNLVSPSPSPTPPPSTSFSMHTDGLQQQEQEQQLTLVDVMADVYQKGFLSYLNSRGNSDSGSSANDAKMEDDENYSSLPPGLLSYLSCKRTIREKKDALSLPTSTMLSIEKTPFINLHDGNKDTCGGEVYDGSLWVAAYDGSHWVAEQQQQQRHVQQQQSQDQDQDQDQHKHQQEQQQQEIGERERQEIEEMKQYVWDGYLPLAPYLSENIEDYDSQVRHYDHYFHKRTAAASSLSSSLSLSSSSASSSAAATTLELSSSRSSDMLSQDQIHTLTSHPHTVHKENNEQAVASTSSSRYNSVNSNTVILPLNFHHNNEWEILYFHDEKQKMKEQNNDDFASRQQEAKSNESSGDSDDSGSNQPLSQWFPCEPNPLSAPHGVSAQDKKQNNGCKHGTARVGSSNNALDFDRLRVRTLGADRSEIRGLPALRDVSPIKREELFISKLKLCSVVFTFNNDYATASDKCGKDMKRQTLLELVDYVNTSAGQNIFTESIMSELMNMVSANICRALPPATDNFDPEEDAPVLEPAWPHLQVAYEFFLKFIVSSKINARTAKKYVNQKFCFHIVELFDSEDPRERDYLKTILHRIYGKFMSHRAFIRRSISNVFYRFVYETERHNGIGELLEILGSIIHGFAIPLKNEHLHFLVRALIPLHKPKAIALYHQQLSYCIMQYIEKDADTAMPILNGIFRFWPWSSSPKQVLFLNELEEILESLRADQSQVSINLLMTLKRCLDSDHFQVVERTLLLWDNQKLVNSGCLSRLNANAVLPKIYRSLFKNSCEHRNEAVAELAQNVLKRYRDYDIVLYNKCTKDYNCEEENGNIKLKVLESLWNNIEQQAASTVQHQFQLTGTTHSLNKNMNSAAAVMTSSMTKVKDHKEIMKEK